MIDPFKYVPPDPKNIPAFEAVANDIATVYHCIQNYIPDSREKSLAITKLQEARMWANAAISFHGVNGNALEKE